MMTSWIWSLFLLSVIGGEILHMSGQAAGKESRDLCPPGYVHYQDTCYGHVDIPTTFRGAQNYCHQQKGSLALVKHKKLNDFLALSVVPRGVYVWIGASALEEGATFVWEDKTKVTWTNWDQNSASRHYKNEKAVVMASWGTWSVVSSKKMHTLICAVPRKVCPDGYHAVFNFCYGYDSRQLVYTEARDVCKQKGGTLAFPTLEILNELLSKVLEGRGKDVWIGANDLETEGVFEQEDGQLVSSGNWAPGEPNDLGQGEDAVIMRYDGKWMDVYSRQKHPFYCSVPKTACPQGFTHVSGTCYRYEEKAVTFPEAQDTCRRKAGFVAYPKMSWINKLLMMLRPDATKMWIGAYSKGESDFVWEDGSLITWEEWATDEPSGEGKNGVVMTEEGTWLNVYSRERHPYICAVNASECPATFDRYRSGCHKYVHVPVTFTEAQADCRRWGGYVASPYEEKENEYLSKTKPDVPIWIGANDLKTEGTFLWDSGSPLNWSNWVKGEPDNLGRGQDAVMMRNDGQWMDVYSRERHPYFCTVTHTGVQTND